MEGRSLEFFLSDIRDSDEKWNRYSRADFGFELGAIRARNAAHKKGSVQKIPFALSTVAYLKEWIK